jgi:hypothetical protein
MLRKLKFKLLNMFREFLVYHSSSLEFRAELILLMIMSDGKIEACEEEIIKEISEEIYSEDKDRARLLSETIHEFHDKIITKNVLEYTYLITKISNDIKRAQIFDNKIIIEHLRRFRTCLDYEENQIFHDRIICFLQVLKEEYGEL